MSNSPLVDPVEEGMVWVKETRWGRGWERWRSQRVKMDCRTRKTNALIRSMNRDILCWGFLQLDSTVTKQNARSAPGNVYSLVWSFNTKTRTALRL